MFQLPPLPYQHDALEPVVSKETMTLHHDRHHAKYVETLNQLLGDEDRGLPLEEVVRRTAGTDRKKLYNNAGQAWNHAFFWECMVPRGGPPEGDIVADIAKAFGDHDGLKKAFVDEGVAHFGSGWVWLASDGGDLKVLSTHDGDNLIPKGMTPLLVCDLWEHAYYVDYRNDRKAFLEAWFDKLPHWAFASKQLEAAQGKGEPWRYPRPEQALA